MFAGEETDKEKEKDTGEGIKLFFGEEKKESKYRGPKELKGAGLGVKNIHVESEKMKQVANAEAGHIPKASFRLLINGESGSGKTMTVCNMLTSPHFYNVQDDKGQNYFPRDNVYLFSPTSGDSCELTKILVQYGVLDKKNIFTAPTPEALQEVVDKQIRDIKYHGGVAKEEVKRCLIIMDDCQGLKNRFLYSNPVVELFNKGRHRKISSIIMGQSYRRTEKSVRDNATDIIVFPVMESEMLTLSNEVMPAGMTKKEFRKILAHATDERFSFLYINKRAPTAERFRKNFDTLLEIPH